MVGETYVGRGWRTYFSVSLSGNIQATANSGERWWIIYKKVVIYDIRLNNKETMPDNMDFFQSLSMQISLYGHKEK